MPADTRDLEQPVSSALVDFFSRSSEAGNCASLLRRAAVACRAIPPKRPFLLTPIVLPQEQRVSLERDLAVLEAILRQAPERFFAGDYSRWLEWLGYTPSCRSFLVRHFGRLSPCPLRWDLVQGVDGRWRVVELNAGYALGGVVMCELAGMYASLTEIVGGADSRFRVLDDTADRIAAEFARSASVEPGDCVAIIEAENSWEVNRWSVERYPGLLGRRTRAELIAVPSSALTWTGHELRVGDRRVTHVVAYPVTELFSGPESFRALTCAFEAGQVRSATNMLEHALGSKALLALLHDPALRGSLSAAEREVVDRRVPITRIVDPLDPPFAEEGFALERWVVKPAGESCGRGVVFGCEGRESVERTLARAGETSGRFVLQAVVSSPEIPFVACGPDADLEVGLGRFVLGLITVAGSIVGGYTRALVNGAGLVVNATRGAAAGPLGFGERA